MDPDRALQELLVLDTSSSDDDQISLPSPRHLDCEVGSDSKFDSPQSPYDVLVNDSPPAMETSATGLEVNCVLPKTHAFS